MKYLIGVVIVLVSVGLMSMATVSANPTCGADPNEPDESWNLESGCVQPELDEDPEPYVSATEHNTNWKAYARAWLNRCPEPMCF